MVSKQDKIKESKKLSMRRARAKLKNDPEKYEEEKRKDRERKKISRKKITDLSERDKRTQRKRWRERTKKSRENKKKLAAVLENELSPPSTPNPQEENHVGLYLNLPEKIGNKGSHSRKGSGEKVRRRNNRNLKKKIKELERKNKELERKVEKYKKRQSRMANKTESTPKKVVKKLLRGKKYPEEVKKELIFSEALKKQIKENFVAVSKELSLKRKREFSKVLNGRVVKKYKLKKYLSSITSRRILKNVIIQPLSLEEIKAKSQVEKFFDSDAASRLTAGKKETVTRNKLKKQIRWLNDDLKNLHQEFLKSYPHLIMSYSSFCKLRPFWVLKPDFKKRNTCLCMEHANFTFMLDKLSQLKIVNEKTPTDVLKSITCDGELKETCLERTCTNCKNNCVTINEFENEQVSCFQWKTKTVDVKIKNTIKKCKKTVKEEVFFTKKKLVNLFTESMIPKFMQHKCNIIHQYDATKKIKENLATNDILIHCDFSENYSCKLSEEVQSLHFGGSRNQISLHTVIVYYHDKESKATKPLSLCTLSEDRRHDYVGICAHLKPVIDYVKKNIAAHPLKNVHFLSDGPSQQYRNKNMFYLITTFFQQELKCENIRWHFTEKGHGKGAPDGIGATIKRTADTLIAHGKDIPDIKSLIKELNEKNLKVVICQVPNERFNDFENCLPKGLESFKGTLKVHEVTWQKQQEKKIHFRRLTCLVCTTGIKCVHYGLGSIDFKQDEEEIQTHQPECSRLRYKDVYSSDDDDEEKKVEEEIRVAKPSAWVLVKFATKKDLKHYVGQILEMNQASDDYVVKFLRKCGNCFQWPVLEDVSVVTREDIVIVLPEPLPARRGDKVIFKMKFDGFNIQ